MKNRSMDDKYYRDMIVEYLRKWKTAKRADIKSLLWDKLPDVLNDKQKNTKITTLLTSLRKKSVIKLDSANQQTGHWILTTSV